MIIFDFDLEFVGLIITDFCYGFLLLFYWLFSISQFSEGNYNLVRWNFVQHEALCNKPLYDISIFHHTSKLISYSSEYGKSNFYLMQVEKQLGPHWPGADSLQYHVRTIYCVVYSEAVVQRCSVKKVFLETSQNSQENTCARISFLITCQAQACLGISKKYSSTGIFLWVLRNF